MEAEKDKLESALHQQERYLNISAARLSIKMVSRIIM